MVVEARWRGAGGGLAEKHNIFNEATAVYMSVSSFSESF